MKMFPWKELLQKHPIFATVRDEKRIDALLEDEVSAERIHAKDEVILRQGDMGDSVFVIGAGSAEAVFEIGAGAPISLSVMRRGEVFGEMSLLERRARSATVCAKEPCTVLEFRGADFEQLMADYPDIEFRILLKMSERLRNASEQVLRLQAGSIDEKLKIFNLKLDTEQKLVDCSLKAAQAMFDQTKLRADEVISSAERSRDRMQKIGTTIITIGTIVGGLLGAVGLKQIWDVTKTATEVRSIKEEAEKSQKGSVDAVASITKAQVSINDVHEKIMAVHSQIAPIARTLETMKAELIGIARGKVVGAVERGEMVTAINEYRVLQALGGVRDEVGSVVDAIEDKVFGADSPMDIVATLELLRLVAKDSQQDASQSTLVRASFLRITYSTLTDLENKAERKGLRDELGEYLKKNPKATLESNAISGKVLTKIQQQQGAKAEELRALRQLVMKL